MKMYNKNIRTFLILFSSILLFSCNEDNGAEELFEENPTERLNQEEQELRNQLVSSEYGWKATYFTNDEELGGWTFIFDFNDNQNVTMVSDFSENTLEPKTSEYDIIIGSTLKLSFTTNNYIHNLSDSNTYPDQDFRGRGYMGDFEFLYYGQEGEDLIFRSNRLQKEVRFTKATQEDWNSIEENRETLPLLNQSVFSKLIINEGGETETFNFGFSYNRRYATVTNPEVFNRDISFGVAPNSNGISISPGIEVNGETITELTYDAANNRFVSSMDNPAVEIIFSSEPFEITDDYQDFSNYAQYGYIGDFAGATNTYPTSGAFLDLFNEVQNDLFESEGVILTRIYITVDAQTPYIYFIMDDEDGNDVSEPLFFNYTISNQKVYMTSLGWNDDIYEDYLQPITDMFIQNEGLYVEDLSTSFQGYPKYSFTSAESPNLRITVLAFQ